MAPQFILIWSTFFNKNFQNCQNFVEVDSDEDESVQKNPDVETKYHVPFTLPYPDMAKLQLK